MKDLLTHAWRQSLLDWSLAYAAAAVLAWVVLFLFGQYFGWPETVARFGAVALALGLLPTLVLVWHRDFDYEPHHTRRGLRAFAIACLAVAFGVWRFAPGIVTPSLERILSEAQVRAEQKRTTLAIRPFRVLDPSPETEYLMQGFHDDLTDRLGRLPTLALASQAMVHDLPADAGAGEVADALGVRFVLAGEIGRRGDRIRLEVALTEGARGAEVWAKAFERDPDDILALERELAEVVARSVEGELGAREIERLRQDPTDSPEAYRAFLEGQHHLRTASREARQSAITAFRRAVLLDPRFARAWAGLADAYNFRADLFLPQEVWPVSSALARRAMELDPTLPEVQATQARILAYYDWNLREAEAVLRRALAAGAECGDESRVCETYFFVLSLMGRCDDAVALTEQLVAARPKDASAYRRLALSHLCARRFADAEAALERSRPLVSGAAPVARANLLALLAFVNALDGQGLRAMNLAREALTLAPHEPIVLVNSGVALAAAGDRTGAEAVLGQFDSLAADGLVAPRAYRAAINAWLGRDDEALRLLDDALANREVVLLQVYNDPAFDPLRDDPRFRALVERMGGTPFLRGARR